jgi:lipoic acid synthetase
MEALRKPSWLKKRIPPIQEIEKVKAILGRGNLHTVCEEARCPNLGDCFSKGTATFLILGRVCTRNCGFCAVERGTPFPLNESEPETVARAVGELRLQYVVLTSVTRDDLQDGGASHYAKAIQVIRVLDPGVKIEVLIPDLKGDRTALETVLKEQPDVLNHNVETVPRLYPQVRPQADYRRSLELLQRAKEIGLSVLTKSGFMLGLGETQEEVLNLIADLREVKCDFLTIGQYLQPRSDRLPVVRYVAPDEFEEYQQIAQGMGFKGVASGPFIRSSFHASQMFENHTNHQVEKTVSQ